MSKFTRICAAVLALMPMAVNAQEAGTSRDTIDGQSPDDFYCGERRLGQWFYCSKPKPRDTRPASPQAPEPSAAERMAAIAKELDELKARAILDPSEENVIEPGSTIARRIGMPS